MVELFFETNKISIDEEKILALVKSGELYLFQIYARDLGKDKKNKYGPSQMLKYILSDENINKMTARLTGGV